MSSKGHARRKKGRPKGDAKAPLPDPPSVSPWLASPAFDLGIYAGSTLWAAALVLALGRWVEPVRLWYVFNIVFTTAHYGPTWLRAYADREERTRHGWSLYVFPPAVFAFAWLTRDQPEVLAFITFFWDRWHALMQNYGFMRLYDAKASTSSRNRARLDFALLVTSALFMLSMNMGLLAPFLAAFDSIGLAPVTSVGAVRGIQIGFGIATGVAAILWLREAWRVRQAGIGRQAPRISFLIGLVGGHALMNTTTNIFILSAHEKVYHSLQYVALSWQYSNRRVARTSPATTGGVFRALFAPQRWPLYILVVAAWTVLAFLANLAIGTNATGPGLFTALIGGLALCHYYFDSFLWRVRRPEVRASL